MSLVLDEHRQYLADAARVSAFRQAIEEVVKPGDVVLDLGAGTGILGLMACRAGARRVYAIDEGAIIGLARDVARANGFHDRIHHVKAVSTRTSLPERVDVIVADQIGRFGFEAGLVEYFADARQRFLRPGGATIPRAVTLVVAPVECPELFANVEFWDRAPAGYEFHPARAIAQNTGYPARFDAAQLLGAPAVAVSLDVATVSPGTLRAQAALTAARPGTLHGLGGWFEARLSPGVTLTNSPLADRPIRRMQVFLPIARPVDVIDGDAIHVGLTIRPADAVLGWTVEIQQAERGSDASRPCRARFAHSTLQGMLLCREDITRTEPGFVPRLSAWGRARRSVLELCDGARTLREIEEEMHRRHGELFRSSGAAAGFVAEVVTRYAE
jgi:ribosomal protein L11 methyltransferase PrmA/PRMT5 arginine-N-methyltransferase